MKVSREFAEFFMFLIGIIAVLAVTAGISRTEKSLKCANDPYSYQNPRCR